MFAVLLVEDEPAALRYLRALIERKCPEFTVVATAGNGLEALEVVRRTRLDLVITDVRMSGMDGLDFVASLKGIAPEIPAVIVSGHQEFEYARRALNTGVVDYLPKPVSPKRLQEVLQSLRERLGRNAERRTLAALRAAIGGGEPEESLARAGQFRIALLRLGAPPSRFARTSGSAQGDSCRGRLYALRGRDPREWLLVAPSESIGGEEFLEEVEREASAHSDDYHTLLCSPQEVDAGGLAKEASALCRQLDHAVVPGLTQLLVAPVLQGRYADADSVVDARIAHAVANRAREGLESALRDAIERWQRERRPFYAIVPAARRLLQLIRASSARSPDPSELDARVEEAIGEARSFAEATSALCELAVEVAGLDAEGVREAGVPVFFEEIRRFVEAAFAQPLSIQSTCERFRISPTYLSRLFRRYAGCSFNEFVRLRRIEAAQRLIRESPTMPMKSVARSVGFKDEFYFSRVFKLVAGLAPTEFARSRPSPPES